MKKFILELIGSMVVSLLIVPAVILGMASAGTIWEKKLEPWLNKKLGA